MQESELGYKKMASNIYKIVCLIPFFYVLLSSKRRSIKNSLTQTKVHIENSDYKQKLIEASKATAGIPMSDLEAKMTVREDECSRRRVHEPSF